jgi:hypothetical protein
MDDSKSSEEIGRTRLHASDHHFLFINLSMRKLSQEPGRPDRRAIGSHVQRNIRRKKREGERSRLRSAMLGGFDYTCRREKLQPILAPKINSPEEEPMDAGRSRSTDEGDSGPEVMELSNLVAEDFHDGSKSMFLGFVSAPLSDKSSPFSLPTDSSREPVSAEPSKTLPPLGTAIRALSHCEYFSWRVR